jgi:hypothetical protein
VKARTSSIRPNSEEHRCEAAAASEHAQKRSHIADDSVTRMPTVKRQTLLRSETGRRVAREDFSDSYVRDWLAIFCQLPQNVAFVHAVHGRLVTHPARRMWRYSDSFKISYKAYRIAVLLAISAYKTSEASHT